MTYTYEEVRRPFLPKTLGYAETMYDGGRLGCLLMERIAFTFHELLEKFSEGNPSPECLELVGVCVRGTNTQCSCSKQKQTTVSQPLTLAAFCNVGVLPNTVSA